MNSGMAILNRCVSDAMTTVLLVLALLPGTALGDRPNVLMIVVDDMNDWIGCLGGHPDVKTPNIDRLAARGDIVCQWLTAPRPICNRVASRHVDRATSWQHRHLRQQRSLA